MLGYELELDHFKGASARLSHYQHDLQPGVVWNVTRKISVNSYLPLFHPGAVSTANAGLRHRDQRGPALNGLSWR